MLKVMKWTLEEEKMTIHQILEKPGEPVTKEYESQSKAIKSIQDLLAEKEVIACYHDYDSTTKMLLDMSGKALLVGRHRSAKAAGTNGTSNIETFLARYTRPTVNERTRLTIIYTKDFIHYPKFKCELGKAYPSNGGEVEKLAPVTTIITTTTSTLTYNLSLYVSYVRLLQEYQLRNITRDGDDIIPITRHYYNDGLFYNITDIDDGVIKTKFIINPKGSVNNSAYRENYSNPRSQIDNIVEHAKRRDDDVTIIHSIMPVVYDNPKPYDGKRHFLIVKTSEQVFCPFIEERHEVKGINDFSVVDDGEGDFWKAMNIALCDLYHLREVKDWEEQITNGDDMQEIAVKLKVNIFLIFSNKETTFFAYKYIKQGEEAIFLDKEPWLKLVGQHQQEYINHICLYCETDATTSASIIDNNVRFHAMLQKPKIHNKVLQNNLSFYYSLIYALSGVSILRNYWVSRDHARNHIYYDLSDENNAALQYFKTLIGREQFDDVEELSIGEYIKLLETLVSKLNGVHISLHLEQTPIPVFLFFGNLGHSVSYEKPKIPLSMKYQIDLRMVYDNGKCRFDYLGARSNDNHMDILMGGINRIGILKDFPAIHIATRVPLRPEANNSFNADSRRARMMGLLHIGPQVFGKNEKTQTLYFQYLEGKDLARLVADDPCKETNDTSKIKKISDCIVNLIAMTVEVGIVHLDFKPANIMVSTETNKPYVRIIDWDIDLVVGIHECTNDLQCNDFVFRVVATRLMLGQLISHLSHYYKNTNVTRNALMIQLALVRNEIPNIGADSHLYKGLCEPKRIPKEAPPHDILNNSIILKKLKDRNINDKMERIINHYFVKRKLGNLLRDYKNEWLGNDIMITPADEDSLFMSRIPLNRNERRLYMSKELSDACKENYPFVSVVDEADATPIEVESEENLMEIAMENEKSDLDIRRRWSRDDDFPSRVKPECLPKSLRPKSTRGPP